MAFSNQPLFSETEMKKILLSAALLIAMSFSSCKQFLDVKPTDLLVEDLALITHAEFVSALNGAYAGLVSGSYYGGNFMALADVPADNLKFGPGATGLYQFLYNLNYATDTNEFEEFYQQAYLAVYRANLILGKLDASELTPAQKSQIRSECLMIRALAHHDLVRVFAQRYDATADGSHDGIAIKTDVSLLPPPRNSIKEVYTQIIADINAALPTLPTTGVTRFSQRSANALRARVALYMRDWTTAETFATTAITGGPVLATGTAYTDMWAGLGTAAGESIFKFTMPVGFAALGGNYWNLAAGNDFFAPTEDIRTLYDGTDIRLSSFISLHTSGAPGRYIVKKYEGILVNPGLADIKVIRTSEMYLIRAEARARKSSPDEVGALADLNAVRTARVASTGTETGASLITGISIERRKEFFLEGHRWFDLKRDQQAVVRIDCNAAACTLPASSYRFTFPIPQAELFANKNMKQNPGY